LIVDTKRLMLRLMNADEVIRYSENTNPFDDLPVSLSKYEISETFKPVISNVIIPKLTQKNKDLFFNSIWLLIEKRFLVSAGSLMFKGDPDRSGKVEIGYGTNEEYQNRGYMTEAVGAICRAAFETGKVKKIIAETAKDNESSFGVLIKNDFRKYTENDEFYYWEKLK
jgi:[ribosomal protein S5]-alanine N-acetyltransferase